MFYRALLTLCLTTAAVGGELTPVDQAVGDLDALGASMRQAQPNPQRVLYRLEEAQHTTMQPMGMVHHAPAYYRVSPGVTAAMDNRIDYVVRAPDHPGRVAINIASPHDGEFRELVPPNTVFILKPLPLYLEEQSAHELPQPEGVAVSIGRRIDTRVETRLNTLIDGRIDTRIDSRRPR